MITYSIRDWDLHYENNRTRSMKRMSWVPIPVKLAGDGYTQLVAGRDGAAMYGCWVALVLVAAACEPRGTLMRGNGTPHDAVSLARITRMSTRLLQRTLDVCQIIGWVEVTGIPQEGALFPQEGAGKVPSLEGRKEGRKLTVKRHPGAVKEWVGVGFDLFWTEYPRKRAKQAARKAWAKLLPEGATIDEARDLLKAIIGMLRERCDEWDGREADKIPHPATWLRAEDFNDETDR